MSPKQKSCSHARAHTHTQTHSARVALQEFDFLIEFDVVCSQAVQFILQGLHGLLHGAIFLPGW